MTDAKAARPLRLNTHDDAQKPRTALQDTWAQLARNRPALLSLIFVVALVVMALGADVLRNIGLIEDINDQHRGSSLALPLSCATMRANQQPYPPGERQFCFVFGADALGRDVLSRTVYGTRVSLAVAVVGAVMTTVIGVLYGVISGYYGGWVDNLMMRFVDFLYGIPSLVLVILFQAFFKSLDQAGTSGLARTLIEIDRSMGGLFFLFIALSILSWINMARLARGEIMAYKHQEFVEAARAVGASNWRIIFVHLLPNITGPLVVATTLEIPAFIFTEAFLSFIGLGVEAPTPSWGGMISTGRDSLTSLPNLILVPGIALALTTLAFNFLGDGLRDALDPHARRT
jgi:ABC-type dipeptide/oligopeptide/nickel transport system permease subunit